METKTSDTEEYKIMNVEGKAIDPYMAFRNKKEHQMCDAIIVAGKHCATTYEMSPDCMGKVHQVNFGVDSEKFHPAEKQPEEFKLMYSGGNWIRKGFRYLLTAWKELKLDGMLTALSFPKNRWPPVRRVNYTEWVNDDQVAEYFRRQSVFCLPSLEEGQALVVLEAMASGLPVIVTEETGAPIEDGKEGLFVPSRNLPKLKEAIQYMYDNPSEVKKMGRNARKKAESLTWEKFGEQVLQVCEEVWKK